MMDGFRLRRRLVEESGFLVQELVGSRYGSLEIVSQRTEGASYGLCVEVQCSRCGKSHMGRFHNMRKRPHTAACPHCNPRRPVIVPKWLYQRCQGQRSRCVNPRSSGWKDYGARGVQFKFESANAASIWVAENLGVPEDRSLQLDRVDNSGHYEPGNLRWATQSINMGNTRKSDGSRRARFGAFRTLHPEIKYADTTLVRLMAVLTDEQIIKRWMEPSHKPKGKYGTFTTQGLYRGSLRTGA